MSPFGGSRVLKTYKTRKRNRRKITESSDDSDRIELPALPTPEEVAIVEVAKSEPTSIFQPSTRPRPLAEDDAVSPSIVYGTPIYGKLCDDYPTALGTTFGLHRGTLVDPSMCDVEDPSERGPYYGDTIYPSADIVYGVQLESKEVTIDEREPFSFDFDFFGGRSSAAYFSVRWYESEEDAQMQLNPITGSRVPSEVVISTTATLIQSGWHQGTLSFTGQSVTEDQTLFGRVDIIDPQMSGAAIDPSRCDDDEQTQSQIYGTPVDPSGDYFGVYPNPLPPAFGRIEGTVVDPEDCDDDEDTSDTPTNVQGGLIGATLCIHIPSQSLNVTGTRVAPRDES